MLPNNNDTNDPPTISSSSNSFKTSRNSCGGMFMDLLLDNCDVSSPSSTSNTNNRFAAATTTTAATFTASRVKHEIQEEEDEEEELVDLMTDVSMSSISLDGDDDNLMNDSYHDQHESLLSSLIPAQPPSLFNRKQQSYEWDENFSLLIRLKTTRLSTIVEEDKSPMFSTTATTIAI